MQITIWILFLGILYPFWLKLPIYIFGLSPLRSANVSRKEENYSYVTRLSPKCYSVQHFGFMYPKPYTTRFGISWYCVGFFFVTVCESGFLLGLVAECPFSGLAGYKYVCFCFTFSGINYKMFAVGWLWIPDPRDFDLIIRPECCLIKNLKSLSFYRVGKMKTQCWIRNARGVRRFLSPYPSNMFMRLFWYNAINGIWKQKFNKHIRKFQIGIHLYIFSLGRRRYVSFATLVFVTTCRTFGSTCVWWI